MNYLIYIEHSAENLQFFLWHRSYVSRFHSANTIDLVLAPEWTQEMQDEAFAKLQKEHREGLKRDPAHVAPVFRGTTFEKKGNRGAPGTVLERPSPIFSETGSNPFLTPPRTPMDREDLQSSSSSSSCAFGVGSHAMSYRSQANEAFAAAGIKAPCKSIDHVPSRKRREIWLIRARFIACLTMHILKIQSLDTQEFADPCAP